MAILERFLTAPASTPRPLPVTDQNFQVGAQFFNLLLLDTIKTSDKSSRMPEIKKDQEPPKGAIQIVPNHRQRRAMDRATSKSTGMAFDAEAKNCGKSIREWNAKVAECDGWQKQALKSHEMAGKVERMRLDSDKAAVSAAYEAAANRKSNAYLMAANATLTLALVIIAIMRIIEG